MKNIKYTSKRTAQSMILILACLILPNMIQAATTDHISQFGITWAFDKEYVYGQFANGDYWVVGPVKIIAIDPASTSVSGAIKNGSMINPVAAAKASYDNRMGNDFYDSALNAARPNGNDLSTVNPLVLQQNSSLVSTISLDVMEPPCRYLKTAAILTVLSSPAPAGSFRPAYSGSDKTIKFNKSNLNYSLLKKLTPVAGTPALAMVEGYFERPWIDTVFDAPGRYIHPVDNMPDYSREMSLRIGDGALMLHLNFTDAQKEKLLIRYVQLGIDLFAITKYGIGNWVWSGIGGQSNGRKWPILFAGLILNDPDMKDIGQKSGDYLYSGEGTRPPGYISFGEDDQTFYVVQSDVDITHSAQWSPDSRDAVKTPYETADLGLPEWGITHGFAPQQSNAWWNTEYRQCCTAISWAGFTLAARIMGARDLWNHDAMFDYTDRYMSTETAWRQWSALASNMWDIYRANYGSVYTGLNTTAHKRIYSSAGATVDCGLISTCSDYPNQQAKDDNPCKLNCGIAVLYGDVSGDGEITAYDAALTAQAAVALITLTSDQAKAADVDGNGEVTAYDAALIAQYAVGIINHFPAE